MGSLGTCHTMTCVLENIRKGEQVMGQGLSQIATLQPGGVCRCHIQNLQNVPDDPDLYFIRCSNATPLCQGRPSRWRGGVPLELAMPTHLQRSQQQQSTQAMAAGLWHQEL
eukprot:s3963_g5.t1